MGKIARGAVLAILPKSYARRASSCRRIFSLLKQRNLRVALNTKKFIVLNVGSVGKSV